MGGVSDLWSYKGKEDVFFPPVKTSAKFNEMGKLKGSQAGLELKVFFVIIKNTCFLHFSTLLGVIGG